MSGPLSPLVQPSPSGPHAHLYWPYPLVADLGPALVTGWPKGAGPAQGRKSDDGADIDPRTMGLCRPAWEVLRMHRRFRGRVVLISGAAVEHAMWVAHCLGLDRNLLPPVGHDPAALLPVLRGQFGVRGFDYLGGLDTAEAFAGLARRVWLIGSDDGLRHRLLTRGVHMTALDAQDRFALGDLMPTGRSRSGWALDEDQIRHSPPAQPRRGAM